MYFWWSHLNPQDSILGLKNQIILSFSIFALHYLWFASVSQSEWLHTSTELKERNHYAAIPRMELLFDAVWHHRSIISLQHLHLGWFTSKTSHNTRGLTNNLSCILGHHTHMGCIFSTISCLFIVKHFLKCSCTSFFSTVSHWMVQNSYWTGNTGLLSAL